MAALPPTGTTQRDAVAALSGYVYQIYQSALAWLETEPEDIIWLEVSEDYLKAAKNALEAVQVKETSASITINSKGVLAAIDSYVELHLDNPMLSVSLRYLSTSTIGCERKTEDRLNGQAVLREWRSLAASGDLTEFRTLMSSKNLNARTKKFIENHDDEALRVKLLRRMHFDCGAPDSAQLKRLINARLSKLLLARGGVHSQAESCLATMVQKLLEVATKPKRNERSVDRNTLEEILEKTTQIVQSRAQFDAHNQLMQKALAASVPTDSRLIAKTMLVPRPARDAKIPKAMATRNALSDRVELSTRHHGVCWIHGGAGMGKTIAARAVTKTIGADWATINFRGEGSDFVARVLEDSATDLAEAGITGLVLDDLECELTPKLAGNLGYLLVAAAHSGIFVVITAPREAPANILFDLDLSIDICVQACEFSADDILEVLQALGLNSREWAKYIHLISGGGHPQLAVTAIQSMQSSGWPKSEFSSLNALLVGDPQIEEVRRLTRLRLLRELPENSRSLLERLSLKLGGFKRSLALELARSNPVLTDGGLTLDTLIGTWIDQHAEDRFSLSPLLSNFATKNLTTTEQKAVHDTIASSLTQGNVFDGSEINAAMFSAWIAGNEDALLKLCMMIFGADHDDLELLAQHVDTLTLMRTDQALYAGDKAVSHMLRGAQLILVSQKSDSLSKFWDVYERFELEGEDVRPVQRRSSMDLMIYSKLLLLTPKQPLGARFVSLITKLNNLLNDKQSGMPEDIKGHFVEQEMDGVKVTGFMFQNQCHSLNTLRDLEQVFEFLDQSQADFRDTLLSAYRHNDFEIDMLVSNAWLSEHKAETIEAKTHSALFLRLEDMAKSWGYVDLAVCCCKYQSIILNEYGSDKQGALDIIERGLTEYGATNSELVREKAKVLHLSGDHAESLSVASMLLESGASLNPVEQAFFGRQAAISAENEGRYDLARQYYLFASEAAKLSKLEDMEPMHIGLLADAALASWLDGDRETGLRDFASVLGQVTKFAPDRSLRTSHCHAVVRHLLLWMEQDATGEKKYIRDGEETRIYPGCASQPEPHKDIGEQLITPIEMAWYMLARIECFAELDVGIMENLHSLLPRGEVREGQILFASAKMHKALATMDVKLFGKAMRSLTATGAFIMSHGSPQNSFNIEDVTFGTIPSATNAQRDELKDHAARQALLFAAMCIFRGQPSKIEELVAVCRESSGFVVDPYVTDRLVSSGDVNGFFARLAELLREASQALGYPGKLSPLQVFELSIKTLQVAEQTQDFKLVGKALCVWLATQWAFAWEHQRFRLNRPSLHEEQIKDALLNASNPSVVTSIELLTSILPLLSISNSAEVNDILQQMLSKAQK